MRERLTICFAVALSVLVSLAFAQDEQAPPQGDELKLTIADTLSVTAPPGWQLANQGRDWIEIYVPLRKEREFPRRGEEDENPKPTFVVSSEAGMVITIERRKDHAGALRRLSEISSEYPEDVELLLISGWPALERQYRAFLPQTGENGLSTGNVETTFTTTAVAVDSLLVRFNTMFAPDADQSLIEEALTIGRRLSAPQGPDEKSRGELEQIRRIKPAPQPTAPMKQPEPGGSGNLDQPDQKAGIAVQVHPGVGEVEVASNDGQHVVVAANSGYSFSADFGATFTLGGGTPCTAALCDGDPSLAVGNSGAIYYAWIGGPSLTALGDGISRSTDDGQTFPFQGWAATCPGTTGCRVADQEHIAADRNNAAAGGGDLIYNVWRNFPTAGAFSLRISCSSDSGSTWTGGVIIGAGDFPRVSVGGDGFVYVAWASGGNMMLHKYSNCDSGLTPQAGWPVTVAPFTNVACPVPGLDRCNGRNILSSPMVAADDLNPDHIYYTFATSTVAGNENIMVLDSTDGGATFPRSVQVNNAVSARRFMPWISTYGGMAVVSWYDRRNATGGNNDLTRFFIGGARVLGPNLVALTEADLSGIDDNQCSTWPAATNAVTDSESCSVQPQLAGRCVVPASNPPAGSFNPCDFSDGGCPSGETCSIGRGAPKYGDYNGNATGAGRMYSAWASSVPPTSVGGAGGTLRVYASADRMPSDFYVRDWNASPDFDNGQQPSTHAQFWTTSDVWNQSTSVAAPPGVDGSVLGDPPSIAGPNYVYAKISRRAPAAATAPNATVTANFFRGDFGLGAPFTPIGSEPVTFAAGDMTQITPAHSWSAPSGSIHLCLAVEIDGPDGDTTAAPSVSGTAPGPADPLILIDNNKAQRNLMDLVGTGGAGTELIAVIRNSEAAKRVMRLRVMLPEGVSLAGNFQVIGGRKSEIGNEVRIEIGELAPDEIRWLRFRVTSLAGVDKPVPIHVFEDTEPPANGFTLLLRRDSLENVARRNLANFANILARIAHVEKNALADEQAEIALKSSADASEDAYADYLHSNRASIRKIIATHLRIANGNDQFEIKTAADELWGALDENNLERATLANSALTERLNAQVSDLMHAGLLPAENGGKKGVANWPMWWWYIIGGVLILLFFLIVFRRRSK